MSEAVRQATYQARTFDGTGFSSGLATDLDAYLNVFGHDVFVHDFNNDHHRFIAWAVKECDKLKINPHTYEKHPLSGSAGVLPSSAGGSVLPGLIGAAGRTVGRSGAYSDEDWDALPGLAGVMGRTVGRSSVYVPEDWDVLPGLVAPLGATIGRSSAYSEDDVDVLPGLVAPISGSIGRTSPYALEDVDGVAGLVAPAGRVIGRSGAYSDEDADSLATGIGPVFGRAVGRSSVYTDEDVDSFSGLSAVSGRAVGRSSAHALEDADVPVGVKPVVGRVIGRTSAYDLEDPDEYVPFKVLITRPSELLGKFIFSRMFDPANYWGARWPASSGVSLAYCSSTVALDKAFHALSLDELVNFHMATVRYESRDIPLSDLVKVQVDPSGAKSLDSKAPAMAGRSRLITALFNQTWSLPDHSVDIDPAAKTVLSDLRSYLSTNSLDGLEAFGFEPDGSQGFFINFEHLDPAFRSTVLHNAADLNAVKALLPVTDYRVNNTAPAGMNTEFPRIVQKWEADTHEAMTISGIMSTLLEKFHGTPEFDPLVEYLERSLHWTSPIYSITKQNSYDPFRVVDWSSIKRVFDSFVPGVAPNEHAPTYLYPLFAPKDGLTGTDLRLGTPSRAQKDALLRTNAFHDGFVTGDMNTMLDIILRKFK